MSRVTYREFIFGIVAVATCFILLRQDDHSLRTADLEAIKVGLATAQEKAAAHNDTLGTLRDLMSRFVPSSAVRWSIMALFAGATLATAWFKLGGAQ